MATKLCNFNEIPDQSGRGFEVAVGFEATGDFEATGSAEITSSLVLVRIGDNLFAYQNACPHVGTPLNWMPDQFMDYHKRYIQCATHGALFEPDTGLCISGPCQGCYLSAVEIDVIEEQVFLR